MRRACGCGKRRDCALAEPRALLAEERRLGDASGVDGAEGDARLAVVALVEHVGEIVEHGRDIVERIVYVLAEWTIIPTKYGEWPTSGFSIENHCILSNLVTVYKSHF